MNKEYIEHTLAGEQSVIFRQAMEALKRIAPLDYATEPGHVIHDRGYDFLMLGSSRTASVPVHFQLL